MAARLLEIGRASVRRILGARPRKDPSENPVWEGWIYNEAIVGARREEQAISWYYLIFMRYEWLTIGPAKTTGRHIRA